jgi:multisubunit Na+/H+ antiporter MnhB subunit
MPLSRTERATDIALLGFVAIGVASLADLVAGFAKVRPWMLPLAMLLGGAGAVVAASLIGSPALGPAALVGFLCAAVSHATRRMLSVLPAVTSVRGQLSTAAASLLVPGVVTYGLALAIVG